MREGKAEKQRVHLGGDWACTHIAEAVDGALDEERACDEEGEHGGDGPRGRERQRPHLPFPRDRGVAVAARHLPSRLHGQNQSRCCRWLSFSSPTLSVLLLLRTVPTNRTSAITLEPAPWEDGGGGGAGGKSSSGMKTKTKTRLRRCGNAEEFLSWPRLGSGAASHQRH